MSRLRDRSKQRALRAYRRSHVLWNSLALLLGVYLGVAAILEGSQTPSESAWRPWSAWFVGALAAAVYVPVFALLNGLEAGDARREAAARALDADMTRQCQELAAALVHECPSLRLEDVAVQVWLCDEATGAFDRRWRFFLPFDRVASGVEWRRGKGIAGTAWELGQTLAVDLAPLRELDRDSFLELAAEQRYGMSTRISWLPGRSQA